VQQLLQPAARPVGRVCTVTESLGSAILALDGRPVQEVVSVCVRPGGGAAGRGGRAAGQHTAGVRPRGE